MKPAVLVVLFALFLALPLPLQAQTSASATNLALTPSTPVILIPGDALRIVVWAQPEFSGEFSVAADSTVRHPLYRQIKVAGVPMEVVEQRFRTYLQEWQANPQFVIEPLFRVAVAGSVRSPSIYTFAPEATIAEAVVRAGGPTELARTDRVRLRREGQEYLVDLTYPEQGAAAAPVRSGDQIIVPQRANFFRDQVLPVITPAATILSFVYMVVRFERLGRRLQRP